MAKVQAIYSDNPGAIVNASYTLPPGLDVELASVRARVNGAGAGGDFIVVCEILTSDGKLLAQSPIEQTLSAGDTLAGTWAPFLRQAAASTPAGSFALPVAYLTAFESAVGGLRSVAWDSFETNDLTVFGTATTAAGAVTNTSGDVYLRGLATGFYLFKVTVDWDTPTDNQSHGLTTLNGTVLNLGGAYAANTVVAAVFDHTESLDLVAMAAGTTPYRGLVELANGSGSDASVTLAVYYWPGDDLASVF